MASSLIYFGESLFSEPKLENSKKNFNLNLEHLQSTVVEAFNIRARGRLGKRTAKGIEKCSKIYLHFSSAFFSLKRTFFCVQSATIHATIKRFQRVLYATFLPSPPANGTYLSMR